MIRFLTAGESHGPQLTSIVEGMPAGISIKPESINRQLERRQQGYGRGGRMKIERDEVEITSGVRGGMTLGSPITLIIKNRDFASWKDKMDPLIPYAGDDDIILRRPRPGHADLPGVLKYHHSDIRNVLERSSARETAIKTAVGALARILIQEICSDFAIISYVTQIGSENFDANNLSFAEKMTRSINSDVSCPDADTTNKMKRHIDEAKEKGDSLGGVIEIEAKGLPVGLGSHVHWDRRLDGLLAWTLMAIPAIKGVEVGAGFRAAGNFGSLVHDTVFHSTDDGFYRKTNNAGGIEGGMTNGENLLLRIAMKPIPTLRKPLQSVDIDSKEPLLACFERSDVCAVPAAGVIAEAAVCLTLANALLEKFGSDEITEIKRNYESYLKYVQER